MKAGSNRIEAVVTDVVAVNELVKRFHFQRVDGGTLPTFSGGAHIVVEGVGSGWGRNDTLSRCFLGPEIFAGQ